MKVNMNPKIDTLYQDIGQESFDLATDLQGKMLVYAEVEDGFISGSFFYEKGALQTVTFKYCPERLRELIYTLWEHWKLQDSNVEWRAIAFFVNDGKFSIDLTYPEQINPNEGLSERRPRIIKKYFGDVKVDFSKP